LVLWLWCYYRNLIGKLTEEKQRRLHCLLSCSGHTNV
jgi:hypothetical protein